MTSPLLPRYPKDGRVHFAHVRCHVIVEPQKDCVVMEDVTTGRQWETRVEPNTGRDFIRETFGLEPIH